MALAHVMRLLLAAAAFSLTTTAAAAGPAGAVVIRQPGVADTARSEGTATLRVLARAGERIRQVDLDSSSGDPAVDAAAMRAVQRWRKVPAAMGDEPEWLLVRMVFTAPARTIRSASR